MNLPSIEEAEKIYSALYKRGWRLVVLYHGYGGPSQAPIVFVFPKGKFKIMQPDDYMTVEVLKPADVKNSSYSVIEAIISFNFSETH